MHVMSLTTAVGAVNVLAGGSGVNVAGVQVSATSYDTGEDLELAVLLGIITTGSASAALLAGELGLDRDGEPDPWKGWVHPPRGSAAPIQCVIAASADQIAAGDSADMTLSAVLAAVSLLAGGMGIDVAALTVTAGCPAGAVPTVHIEAGDVVSARLLASDLGLSQNSSQAWEGTICPARSRVQVRCTVTVRPTEAFLTAMAQSTGNAS